MYTVIINGTLVTEERCFQGTLVIGGNGKIEALLSPEADYKSRYPGCEIVDAKGQYVVPGGVDGHVHFGGFGDTPIADDFYTGSKAALAGGTTTVVDFCECLPGQTPGDCVRARKRQGEDAAVDFALHFTFTEDYRQELSALSEVLEEGVRAFKAYTYYPHTSLLPGDFRTIMAAIHDKGVLLVHAEEKSVIDCMKMQYPAKDGDMMPLSLTRPAISEQLAVEAALAISKEMGTKLCIAHTSSGGTADILARERAAGNHNFLLETCPHYLEFTSEKLRGDHGALYTINPPLREATNSERLKKAVMQEEISILSTDHCPFAYQYKMDKTYETVPCGVDGVQTRMNYLFSEFVVKRGLPMETFVRMTSANAARFYGIYPRKGSLTPGSDADLAFFDPSPCWVYSKKEIAGATDYTIFEGFPMQGKCTCVIKNGVKVMENNVVTAKKGSGQFLPEVYEP